MKNFILNSQISPLVFVFLLLSCSSTIGYSDEEFIQRFSDLMEVYRSVEKAEYAEMALLALEKDMLAIEGNPEVVGKRRKNEFLFKTRLRLWGLYKHKGKVSQMRVYRELIQSMLDDKGSPGVNDEFLEKRLLNIDKGLECSWK